MRPGRDPRPGRGPAARLVVIGVLLLCGAGVVLAAADHIVSWYVVGAGGGETGSDQYSMTGTVGQPVVGPVASTGHRIEQGFWTGIGVAEAPPTPGPTDTPGPTNTPRPTLTATSTPSAATQTPTATRTPSGVRRTPTPTSAPKETPTPTATSKSEPRWTILLPHLARDVPMN